MSSSHNDNRPDSLLKAQPASLEHLPDAEYGRLAEGLDRTVMPLLADAASRLVQKGFLITKLEHRDGLASLVVRNRRPNNMRGWIYFQIHRSFGPLLCSERVFWMYSVQHATPLSGKPGRLKDFSDAAAVSGIVENFVGLCGAALRSGENFRDNGTGPRREVREGTPGLNTVWPGWDGSGR